MLFYFLKIFYIQIQCSVVHYCLQKVNNKKSIHSVFVKGLTKIIFKMYSWVSQTVLVLQKLKEMKSKAKFGSSIETLADNPNQHTWGFSLVDSGLLAMMISTFCPVFLRIFLACSMLSPLKLEPFTFIISSLTWNLPSLKNCSN